jgi:hypothetical protein
MKSIYDYVNANEIAAYYAESASNKIPYLGATLWPAKKKLGLDLSWIKGSKGLPVALKPSTFDAKATVRDRIGFKKVETEMPFFRESMRIGEKDRQEINKFLGSKNIEMIRPIFNKIFDDAGNLVDGAEVNAERMRMQLLSTGKIQITAETDGERVNYDYDYNLPADNKETLTDTAMWSNVDTAQPISDIQRIMDDVEERTGVRPDKAICSRKTWGYLMGNKFIKLDMNPSGDTNRIITDGMVRQYLKDKFGISVAIYNKKYSLDVHGSSAYQFYPDDKFTFLPPGTLGNTWYGTTPEESDLTTGQSAADVKIVNTGVAITTYKEVHPVNVVTLVSAILLPSFESIDQTYILTVAA